MSNSAVGSIPIDVITELPTPCLVVDLAAVDHNIQVAAARAAEQNVNLRPHFKAHKCTRLMRRQLDAGRTSGVTCQTAQEAVILAKAGFDDILVANQIAERAGLAALAEAARLSAVTVAVDALDHVALLTQHVISQDASVGVVIELDVGIGRCGLPTGSDDLLRIAREIDESPGLTFAGLQAYEGHAVLREDRALRRTMVWQASAQAAHERRRLEDAGIEVPLVSGGGTGTFDLVADSGVLDEIQAGSYVLMDARYATLDLPFLNALFCVGTTISRRSPEAAVANVGLKALTVEYGMPRALTPGISVIALSDEHARLLLTESAELDIGDPVIFIPAHIDPAINLYDVLFVWNGQDIESWAVDGRRSHVPADPSNRPGKKPA